jgi:hypothetical protein
MSEWVIIIAQLEFKVKYCSPCAEKIKHYVMKAYGGVDV